MYIRKRHLTPPDFSEKDDEFQKLAHDVICQAEIRLLKEKPLTDDTAIRRLCMYSLHGTQNILILHINKDGKLTRRLSVPLCTLSAVHDDWYTRHLLTSDLPHHRVCAIHAKGMNRLLMRKYHLIMERLTTQSISCKKTFLLFHGFDQCRLTEIHDLRDRLEEALAKYYADSDSSQDPSPEKKRKKRRIM